MADARQEIEAVLERWRSAVKRGDAEAISAECVPAYELILADIQTVKGHDALEEMYCSLFAKAAVELSYEILDLRVDGALAVIYLREQLTAHSHLDGHVDKFTLKRVAMLAKEDGAWKFVRSMVNLQALPVAM
jgi:uncharacterized protein (TIGR02246 family)